MDEALLPKVHAHVRHLALDTEEQKIARAQFASPDGIRGGPQLAGRTRYVNTGPGIRILYKPTAIESAGRTATVPVWHANLLQGHGGSSIAGRGALDPGHDLPG